MRAATAMLCVLPIAGWGCVEVADEGGPWEDAASISGPRAPELGPAPAVPAVPGCTLRVASWNAFLMPDPADLAARLLSTPALARADVLLMQEAWSTPGEPTSRTAVVAEQLGMTWAHQPVHAIEGGWQSNAILSRFPLARVAVKRLPHIAQPVNEQERGAIAADVVLGDERLRVVSVHLDVRISISDRIRQLDPAVIELDERAVVGGDFNTSPWSWPGTLVPLTGSEAVIGMKQAAILDDYMASRRFAGGIAPDDSTTEQYGVGMRVDNLYARTLPIVAAAVEHVGGSDHLPIWIDVDLCP